MRTHSQVLFPNPVAGTVLRLFCLPYAGGSAAIFRNWSKRVPESVLVCPVELPGRGSRLSEPPFINLLDLAEALVGWLRPYLDMPFAFFGHSMGAILCFEAARKLQRENGLYPEHLFVSACRFPEMFGHRRITYNLPDEEFIKDVVQLGGTPEEILDHQELLQLMIPILRADFQACQTYVYSPGPQLLSPITAFGGLQDNFVSIDQLKGWREYSLHSFSLQMLPGNHFLINSRSGLIVDTISRVLQRYIPKQV
jgi:medium-chain acyl-[acyl-carrier-protein] hydrolase